jgi:PAS domain S-box-containing protein
LHELRSLWHRGPCQLLLAALTCAAGTANLQAQPRKPTYHIVLGKLNLSLTVGAMELAVILLLTLLLAIAILLALFARHRARAARRAENAVRASQQMMQSVADNSPAIIYIKDLEGRYALINRRYEKLFHVTAEEMKSKTDYDIFPKNYADAYSAVDKKALATGGPVEAEEVVTLDDGPHTYLSVKYPLRNETGEFYAVCGISTDITDRKRNAEALRESQIRTLAIIDTAPDGVIMIDHEGRIVDCNESAERIFACRRVEAIGRELAETIIPPRLRERHRKGLAHYLATGEGSILGKRIEMPGLRADGTEVPLELSIERMPGAGPPMFTAFVRDITERKEAETVRSLLAGIIASSDDAIQSADLEGIVTSWNAGAERMFGYSSGEIIGQPVRLMVPPEAAGEEMQIIGRIRRGQSINNYETVRMGKDGRRIDVSLTVSPLKNASGEIVGASAIARDISARKDAEQNLVAQVGRLNLLDHITRAIGERQDLPSVFRVVIGTLEDSLPIDFGCVCLYDSAADALCVTCVGPHSQLLAADLGLAEQARFAINPEGLGRCVKGHLVYEPDLSELEFPLPSRLFDGGLRSMVAAPLRAENNVFGVLVAARRLPNGFSSGDCEFLRQLCEHVALAAHQAQLYANLQEAYDNLRRSQQSIVEQERLRVLGQMASGIAHDINNALSPVALYTESLLEREPDLSPRTRQYLETTQRAIEDVSHTVGRMREFYRPREPQLYLSPMDLNDLAKQVLDLTRARWSDMPQEKGIVVHMRTELEPDLPLVPGIESEIREALTNLIFNAVDAMPEGGTLTVRTKSTTNGASPRNVWVQVEDTGVGMDEETRRRCLELFFTTKGERGTGLGLAMVYGVAQRHNAELETESTAGKGTTMGLRFLAVSSAPQPPEIAHAREGRPRLRILVVDDDPLIAKTLRAILEGDGHTVTTAAGGQDGIDMLHTAADSGDPYAVVITDLGMPYVDGRNVAGAVKLASPDTPVILLTGWGQRLVAEEDIPPNVDRVLNKPPKLFQLRAALAELVPAGGGIPSREGEEAAHHIT